MPRSNKSPPSRTHCPHDVMRPCLSRAGMQNANTTRTRFGRTCRPCAEDAAPTELGNRYRTGALYRYSAPRARATSCSFPQSSVQPPRLRQCPVRGPVRGRIFVDRRTVTASQPREGRHFLAAWPCGGILPPPSRLPIRRAKAAAGTASSPRPRRPLRFSPTPDLTQGAKDAKAQGRLNTLSRCVRRSGAGCQLAFVLVG